MNEFLFEADNIFFKSKTLKLEQASIFLALSPFRYSTTNEKNKSKPFWFSLFLRWLSENLTELSKLWAPAELYLVLQVWALESSVPSVCSK